MTRKFHYILSFLLFLICLFYLFNPQLVEKNNWKISSINSNIQLNFVEHFPDSLVIELGNIDSSLASNYSIKLCKESIYEGAVCPNFSLRESELKVETIKNSYHLIRHNIEDNTQIIFSKDLNNDLWQSIYQNNQILFSDKIDSKSIFQGFFVESSNFPIDLNISIESSSRILHKPYFNHLFITPIVFFLFIFLNKSGFKKIFLEVRNNKLLLIYSILIVMFFAGFKFPNLDDGWLIMQSDLMSDMFPLNSPNLMIWEDSLFQGSLLYLMQGLIINFFEIPFFYFFISISISTLLTFLILTKLNRDSASGSYFLLVIMYIIFLVSNWLITTRPEILVLLLVYIFILLTSEIHSQDLITLRSIGNLALLVLVALGTHQTGVVLFLPFFTILFYYLKKKKFKYNLIDLTYFFASICLGLGYVFWNSNFIFVLKSALWIRYSNPGGGHGLLPWDEFTRFTNLYNSASFIQFISVTILLISFFYFAITISLTRKQHPINILELVILMFPLSLTLTASKQPWHYMVLFATGTYLLPLLRNRLKLIPRLNRLVLNFFIIFLFLLILDSQDQLKFNSSLFSVNSDQLIFNFKSTSYYLILLILFLFLFIIRLEDKFKNYLLFTSITFSIVLQLSINSFFFATPKHIYFVDKWKSFYKEDSKCNKTLYYTSNLSNGGFKFLTDPINFWILPCQNNLIISYGVFDHPDIVIGSPSMLDNIYRAPVDSGIRSVSRFDNDIAFFPNNSKPILDVIKNKTQILDVGFSLLHDVNWR